jgi:beta-lactamase regulating signal transducer with metallopeptidase domain
VIVALLAAVLVIGVAIAVYQRPSARAARKLRRLEELYYRKVHMPRDLAEQTLKRHVARLREREPGRGPAWYVAQVLVELGRDRR